MCKAHCDLNKSFDYIVVGSGSAGSALVGTLAAKTDGNILLIEAGDWDTAPSVDDPRVWFTNLGTESDWGIINVYAGRLVRRLHTKEIT